MNNNPTFENDSAGSRDELAFPNPDNTTHSDLSNGVEEEEDTETAREMSDQTDQAQDLTGTTSSGAV